MRSFNTDDGNRTLVDAFNELKQSKSNSIKKNSISPRGVIFKIKDRTKKRGISLVSIIGIIIVAGFVITSVRYTTKTISANSSNLASEHQQLEIDENVKIESNNEKIAIESILSENISSSQRKELVTENRDIEFKTTYKENPTLPRDEQNIIQPGVVGKEIVTVVKVYELDNGNNENFIEEKILNSTIIKKSVEQIVEVGTSEVLNRFKVHLGDTLYTTTDVALLETPDATARAIKTIGKNMDVVIVGVEGNYVKVLSDGITGYIDSNLVVSAYTNPEFVEKCRLEKILNDMKAQMNVAVPTGLTLDDYKKIFTNNEKDKNKVFEQNAEAFYNIEQKYKINGLFVASIGIHESAWGTSNIALTKKNLFGFSAYDSDPYNSAMTFSTYEECIDTVAKVLARDYLNKAGTEICEGVTATGKYYNGTSIADVNIRYATDTNWGTAVYNVLEGLYGKLQ